VGRIEAWATVALGAAIALAERGTIVAKGITARPTVSERVSHFRFRDLDIKMQFIIPYFLKRCVKAQSETDNSD
jgi:hypothetical protein